ncbi:hypothetical protein V8E36_001831 [Tilletia maclaganii]
MSTADCEHSAMSAGQISKVQELYASIQDKLTLEHASNTIVRAALAEIAQVVPLLREGLDQSTADMLDEFGVKMWNASTTLRQLSEGNMAAQRFACDVRLAAVSLLDAGSCADMDIEAKIRLVMAYSSLLSLLSSLDTAKIDVPLARVEEIMHALPKAGAGFAPPNKKLESQLEDARRSFSCAQFDIAFAQARYEDADLHLSTWLDDALPSAATYSKMEPIWRRCFQLGQQHLLSIQEQTAQTAATMSDEDQAKCSAAVKWLQKGITLQEKTGVTGGSLVRALIQLAYAYFVVGAKDKEALSSAEAALDEAMKLLEGSNEEETSELAEYIALLRFRVMSHRGGEADVSRAFEHLCKSIHFSEHNVAQLLDLVGCGPKRLLATSFRTMIQAMIKSEQADVQQHITTVVLRAAFLLSEPSVASQLDALLEDVASASFSLSADAVCAAQMMIWRRGDMLYKKQMFGDAADVHMVATSQAFASMPDNVAKSARRVAVCYLALHQPEAVKACIDLCPAPYRDSASSHLCVYLAAVQMSDEAEALQAFKSLVKAPDLEPHILAEVVEEAQKANMEAVLHAGLETLLDAIKVDNQLEAVVDILALHRTLVCIFLPPAQAEKWTEGQAIQLEVYLRQALKALGTRMDADEDARKLAEWLWKQAYNAAVTASRSFDAHLAASIFSAAFDLMEERHRFSGEAPDESIVIASWCAKFASIEVAAQAVADIDDTDGERRSLCEQLQAQVVLAEKLRKAAHAIDASIAPAEAEWALLLISIRLLVSSQDWPALATLLTDLEARLPSIPFKVCEAIAHTLSVNAEVQTPVEVEIAALKLLLMRYQADAEGQTVNRALRYHRFLVMCLLEDDVFSQVEYRRLALECLASLRDTLIDAEGRGEKDIPVDDVMWYLAQTWEKATELSMMAQIEDAQTLSELALSFSRFVPLPDSTKRRMEIQYETLLRRSGHSKSGPPFPEQK